MQAIQFVFNDKDGRAVIAETVNLEAIRNTYFEAIFHFNSEVPVVTIDASDMFTPFQGALVLQKLQLEFLRKTQITPEVLDYFQVNSRIFGTPRTRAMNVLRAGMRRWSLRRMIPPPRNATLSQKHILFSKQYVFTSSEREVEVVGCDTPFILDGYPEYISRVSWHCMDGSGDETTEQCAVYSKYSKLCSKYSEIDSPIPLLGQQPLTLGFQTWKRRYFSVIALYHKINGQSALNDIFYLKWKGKHEDGLHFFKLVSGEGRICDSNGSADMYGKYESPTEIFRNIQLRQFY